MIDRRILNLSLRALVLLAFLTTAPISRAQQPTTRASSTWSKPFFFIQMSDPQFGLFTSNASFERETVNYESAIASANRHIAEQFSRDNVGGPVEEHRSENVGRTSFDRQNG